MMQSLKGKVVERHLQRMVEASTEYPVWLAVYRDIWDQLETGEGLDSIREQVQLHLQQDIGRLYAD